MALLAAAATIIGGAASAGGSYLATQSSNHAIIQRDERNDQLAARSGARLVETELAQVAVRLGFLQKQRGTNASLVATLHRLPDTEWRANQHVLARTLTIGDWITVSQVYELIEAFASEKQTLVVPDLPIGLLKRDVSDARDALSGYQ